MKSIAFVFVWLALCCRLSAVRADVRPVNLKCEYLASPLGIDAPHPRLSWELIADRRAEKQTAFRIVVLEANANGGQRMPPAWDSGKMLSRETAQIAYSGSTLKSGRRYVWKVRAWDRNGRPSAWSASAWWEMGLLHQSDWHGKWIERAATTAYQPAPLLRRAFTLRAPILRARAYVCGLGYCELSLNGHKVSDHERDPGYTRYDRRVLYVTHDVTRLLHPGSNVVGAMLGTGWYNAHVRGVWDFDKAPWRAAPKLLFQLQVDYADGRLETLVSDRNWQTSTSPITFDSIYAGESYDARLEKPGWNVPGYNAQSWQPARLVNPPRGRLASQVMPPIRVTDTIVPTRITRPRPGVWLVDMGQNFAGHARLRVSGRAGMQITLRYGEQLAANGALDTSGIDGFVREANASPRFQTDTYTLKGGSEETWEARFCYHGFQYVQVEGFPGALTTHNIEGRFAHTDVASVGAFHCSDSLLDRLYRATRWSYLSNLQSIPTDCPQREKNGWTGDAQLACEMGLLTFDSPAVYTKWIGDLADEQKPTGELPGIVPTSGWGYAWGNGPAWDSAFTLIPWYHYLYLGDTRLLTSHYAGMKRYVDYLTSKADKGIVSIGLGDWIAYHSVTPEAVTSTAYYYRDARIVAATARLLGRKAEADKYNALAEAIRRAFQAKFINSQGSVSTDSQTALACALYQDLAPPQTRPLILARLLDAIHKRHGHLFSGVLGAKYVLNALSEAGHSDVAYEIATQKTVPGWGWWIEQGATTLWEGWKGEGSRNHILFGDMSAWMVKTLAGIQPDPASPGFAHFAVRPAPVGGLTFARARFHSVHGWITSDWQKQKGVFTLRVVVPVNATAAVYIPMWGGALWESGKAIEKAPEVRVLRRKPELAVCLLGSGAYTFTTACPRK